MLELTIIHWSLLAYFGIGLGFVEGIRWAREKWKVQPLERLAAMLIFFAWPFVVLFALVLVWRSK